MTPLPPLPVTRASMEVGKLYLWHIEATRYTVVRLTATEDSIESPHSRDGEWLFKHNLKGHLYGPIELVEP